MSAQAGVRLRQAVLVAADLEPVSAELRERLGLDEPFADPGVSFFGLHNAVYAIGDTFLEVISPTQADTAAGRYLDRRGDGGYMAIFQFEDLDAARERAASLGMRVVWQHDEPDISGTHLHPADTGGAIVSLDRADPPGSWRWGGPDWTKKTGTGAPGQLRGLTLTSPNPDELAGKWSALLKGSDPLGNGSSQSVRIELDGSYVQFEQGDDDRIVEIDVEAQDVNETIEIGGARFKLS